MSVPRVQVMALLVMTLILGAVQCVASCAGDDCNSAAPPCHQSHHHPAPSHATSRACTQDFLLPDAPASPLMDIATIGFAAPIVPGAQLFKVTGIFTSPASSPPVPSLSSSSILRI